MLTILCFVQGGPKGSKSHIINILSVCIPKETISFHTPLFKCFCVKYLSSTNYVMVSFLYIEIFHIPVSIHSTCEAMRFLLIKPKTDILLEGTKTAMDWRKVTWPRWCQAFYVSITADFNNSFPLYYNNRLDYPFSRVL